MHLSPTTISWIEESVGPGAQVVSVRLQMGATSSSLHCIDVSVSGSILPLMLRQFTNSDWLAEEPDLAVHESASLQKAGLTGLPVPRLVASDVDGSLTGLQVVLMTRLPGRVNLYPRDFTGWLHKQAEVLVLLHSINPEGFPWRYAPYNNPALLEVPPWTNCPILWKRAIEIVNSPPPQTKESFIHRDYHPVNVLWQGETLSGVVDWPNACTGPAGIDISWQRANLALLHGPAAADQFLELYMCLQGLQHGYHPYWDLMVIIENLPGPPQVYRPWVEYGARDLTDALMIERLDAYLSSVLKNF